MYSNTAIVCVLCWENVDLLKHNFCNDSLVLGQINLDFHGQKQRKNKMSVSLLRVVTCILCDITVSSRPLRVATGFL